MDTKQIKREPMNEEQLEEIRKGIIQVYLFRSDVSQKR